MDWCCYFVNIKINLFGRTNFFESITAAWNTTETFNCNIFLRNSYNHWKHMSNFGWKSIPTKLVHHTMDFVECAGHLFAIFTSNECQTERIKRTKHCHKKHNNIQLRNSESECIWKQISISIKIRAKSQQIGLLFARVTLALYCKWWPGSMWRESCKLADIIPKSLKLAFKK